MIILGIETSCDETAICVVEVILKSGVYSPESFLTEEKGLNFELKILQDHEQASDTSMAEVIKDIVKLSELLKNAVEWWSFANSQEREQIIRIIFSELYISENTFNYKCKNGFQVLEKRFLSFCDPTESRTPLPSLKSLCPNR